MRVLPGMYADAETGLYYNGHRYYDPRIGRYISSDPIGLDGGFNTYTYVDNNPLRWVDPTGLYLVTPFDDMFLGGAGGGATGGGGRASAGGASAGRGGATPIPPIVIPPINISGPTAPSTSDTSSESRSIPQPAKPKCGCTCICRADANDNIPGNIQPGDNTFAFGEATAPNCAQASKDAKRQAIRALGKQPKHVGCRCSG